MSTIWINTYLSIGDGNSVKWFQIKTFNYFCTLITLWYKLNIADVYCLLISYFISANGKWIWMMVRLAIDLPSRRLCFFFVVETTRKKSELLPFRPPDLRSIDERLPNLWSAGRQTCRPQLVWYGWKNLCALPLKKALEKIEFSSTKHCNYHCNINRRFKYWLIALLLGLVAKLSSCELWTHPGTETSNWLFCWHMRRLRTPNESKS